MFSNRNLIKDLAIIVKLNWERSGVFEKVQIDEIPAIADSCGWVDVRLKLSQKEEDYNASRIRRVMLGQLQMKIN